MGNDPLDSIVNDDGQRDKSPHNQDSMVSEEV